MKKQPVSKNTTLKKVSLKKPRPLRGENLVKAAQLALAEMVNLSPKTDPINISALAARLQVTRGPIYKNNLEQTVREYAEMQRKNHSIKTEKAAMRRPLEDRIAELEEENRQMQKKLDGWIEKWAAVEYNAKMHGWDADSLFAPLPPPQRKLLVFHKGK